MFSRSHGSKNSGGGGGAVTSAASHLFNRGRQQPQPSRSAAGGAASSRSPDSHPAYPQPLVRHRDVSAADVAGPATVSSGSSASRRSHDVVYQDTSSAGVQLVSVVRHRSTEDSSTCAQPVNCQASGSGGGRRTRLGLSVAVVRGPTAMNSGGDEHEQSSVNHDQQQHVNSSDLASARAVNDAQDMNETAGE